MVLIKEIKEMVLIKEIKEMVLIKETVLTYLHFSGVRHSQHNSHSSRGVPY